MENKKEPLVSVLIPSCNCAQYIGMAIDSVLAQDYDNLEIIVVDDGSTDNTKAVVERYVETGHAPSLQRKTVKYFYKENGGIASAHNYCLKKASGDYIAWVDADDYWLPGKLRTQLNYFKEHPDCRIVFTKYDNFYDNDEVEMVSKNNPLVQHQIRFAENNKNYLPSSLARKEVFEECGEFDETIPFGEDDTEMICRLLVFGIDMNHFLDEIFYKRRLHGKNITFTHEIASNKQFVEKFVLQNMRKNIQRSYQKK
jgi:glycosyltransferase involved in cell wall biosynthesis